MISFHFIRIYKKSEIYKLYHIIFYLHAYKTCVKKSIHCFLKSLEALKTNILYKDFLPDIKVKRYKYICYIFAFYDNLNVRLKWSACRIIFQSSRDLSFFILMYCVVLVFIVVFFIVTAALKNID